MSSAVGAIVYDKVIISIFTVYLDLHNLYMTFRDIRSKQREALFLELQFIPKI